MLKMKSECVFCVFLLLIRETVEYSFSHALTIRQAGQTVIQSVTHSLNPEFSSLQLKQSSCCKSHSCECVGMCVWVCVAII